MPNTNTVNFTTKLLVDQSPHDVFNAVTNVRGWWSNNIIGESASLGDEFVFEVKGVHRSKQKLVEVVPNHRIVWLVTEANMSFLEDKAEWKGTRVVFDISVVGGKTLLVFTHEGLVPKIECYSACSPAWTQYVQHSLFSLITKGEGDPNLEGRQIEEIAPSAEH